MAEYTTQLRSICETLTGHDISEGFSKVDEIVSEARELIFDFDYPIFDNTYKPVLETKILKHFYTREIGEETFALWQLRLDTRLNEIMPYYNKLYESELLEFNPLYDVDVTTTYTKDDTGSESGSHTDNKTTSIADKGHEATEGTDTGSNTHSGTDSSIDWRLYNDTPQGGIDGIEAQVNAYNYLTDVTKETHEGQSGDTLSSSLYKVSTKDNTYTRSQQDAATGSNTKSLTNLQEYEEHVTGHRSGASFSKALTEFRETFINIDKMIIDELNDLFINLW